MTEYINEHIKILKQLHLWNHLTTEEKAHIKACTTEVQVDNFMKYTRKNAEEIFGRN